MDPKILVIDANIVVKWFIEEMDSKYAISLRDQFINGKFELVEPPLLFFEVINALKYSKLYNKEELNDVGISLENYGFTINAVNGKVREKMVEIALKHDLSMYDAAYVAIAINIKGIFYTADEKILKKLPKSILTHVKLLNHSIEI